MGQDLLTNFLCEIRVKIRKISSSRKHSLLKIFKRNTFLSWYCRCLTVQCPCTWFVNFDYGTIRMPWAFQKCSARHTSRWLIVFPTLDHKIFRGRFDHLFGQGLKHGICTDETTNTTRWWWNFRTRYGLASKKLNVLFHQKRKRFRFESRTCSGTHIGIHRKIDDLADGSAKCGTQEVRKKVGVGGVEVVTQNLS